MAPFMLVPRSRWLVPLGDLDPVDAAPLTDAGLTPYHAVKRSLPLLVPGSTAVVIGAGGLGHMAVQILRALTPATVVAVDRNAEALDHALHLGAHEVVMADEDPASQLAETTRGLGADVTIDLVGSDETLALGAASTRSLGHLTIVGLGGGTLPIGFFSVAYELSVATTYWGTIPELVEVIELARSGRITSEIHRFPLADATAAYDALRAGTLRGRAVVQPSA
jgi:propanol-preferring alcohol dehydrogenase